MLSFMHMAPGGGTSPRWSTIVLTPFDRRMHAEGFRLTRWADGTPVPAWNIWGASPLTSIVHTEVEQEVECMEGFIGLSDLERQRQSSGPQHQ